MLLCCRRCDVFVFPSKTDTFRSRAAGGDGLGHVDLREACLNALKIERADARAWAERFSWRAASEQFASYLRKFGPRGGASTGPGRRMTRRAQAADSNTHAAGKTQPHAEDPFDNDIERFINP